MTCVLANILIIEEMWRYSLLIVEIAFSSEMTGS